MDRVQNPVDLAAVFYARNMIGNPAKPEIDRRRAAVGRTDVTTDRDRTAYSPKGGIFFDVVRNSERLRPPVRLGWFRARCEASGCRVAILRTTWVDVPCVVAGPLRPA